MNKHWQNLKNQYKHKPVVKAAMPRIPCLVWFTKSRDPPNFVISQYPAHLLSTSLQIHKTVRYRSSLINAKQLGWVILSSTNRQLTNQTTVTILLPLSAEEGTRVSEHFHNYVFCYVYNGVFVSVKPTRGLFP